MSPTPTPAATLAVVDVSARALAPTVERLLTQGGSVRTLFAAGSDDRPEIRLVVTGEEGPLLLRAASDGEVESVVGVVPALDWDEREAHDLYGVDFVGHTPMRPLIARSGDSTAWTTPVHGEHIHQIAVGPIHAGVIESGHFRFHAVGERIVKLDLQLFHKHRGLERAAEGTSVQAAIAYVQRMCAACAVSNSLAYVQAVEQARGLWPDDSLRRRRTLLAELERMYNHLNDIGQICAGIGFAAGAMSFAAFKERAQRLNAELFGHRFLFDTVRVADRGPRFEPAAVARARAELDRLRSDTAVAGRAVLFDASVRDRIDGAGLLPRSDAFELGTVGPAGRASGIHDDARQDNARLWYPEFRAATPPEAIGDVAARMELRLIELEATFDIVADLLATPTGPGALVAAAPAATYGVGEVESPRGRTVCALELDGETVRRVHLRTGSARNWPSVARAAEGGIVPDFPLVNKSFELCYACVDR